MNVELARSRILRRRQTFSRRLIDAQQDASPIDGSSEEGRAASMATRLPSQSFHPRQKTRSPAFHATWKPLFIMSPKRCVHLCPIHIGLVKVEPDEVSRNPGIGTAAMTANPIALQPLRRK